MTGIANYSRGFLDSPEERYQKSKYASERFRIIQLGVVPFFRTEENYIAKPYNIYLFPHEAYGNIPINCETSAIIFNREHGMDFNKWIRKGVNYLNNHQFQTFAENLEYSSLNRDNIIRKGELRPDEWEKYDEILDKLNQFFDNPNDKLLTIEKQKRFMENYIVSQIPLEKRQKLYISTDSTNMIFQKVSAEERQRLINLEKEDAINKYKVVKGAKNIFDRIIEKRKSIVGHNFILDLCYCISHFEELPKNYSDFKYYITSSFSAVFDTKYIFNLWNEFFSQEKKDFYDSSLEKVYEILFKNFGHTIQIKIPEDQGFINYLANDNKYHQAGYDAFITGSCFVYMKNALNENQIQSVNYKVNFMKTFYNCFDFKNHEEFVVNNSIPYCLRSKSRTCDFLLENILSKDCFEQVKKIMYIEGTNGVLIFIDTSSGRFMEVERELVSKGQKFFDVLSLDEFRIYIRQQEEDKKNLRKKF